MANHVKFQEGMQVEVRREEPELEGFWYPAKILDAPPEQDLVYVQYDTLMSEADESNQTTTFVKLSNVRLRPPEEEFLHFEPGDSVEGLFEAGWLAGTVKEAVEVGESRKFIVFFESMHQEVQLEKKKLRHSGNWIDGGWIPKKFQVLIETPEEKFPLGMLVEALGDEEFTATTVNEQLEYQKHLKILAPGYKFQPSDQDLISHYLKRCVEGTPPDVISVAEVFEVEPWNLPGAEALQGELEDLYFLTKRKKTNKRGVEKIIRRAGCGSWRVREKEMAINNSVNNLIGSKRVLVYRSDDGQSSGDRNWMMHEYNLPEQPSCLAETVLCKITRSSRSSKGKKVLEPMIHDPAFSVSEYTVDDAEFCEMPQSTVNKNI